MPLPVKAVALTVYNRPQKISGGGSFTPAIALSTCHFSLPKICHSCNLPSLISPPHKINLAATSSRERKGTAKIPLNPANNYLRCALFIPNHSSYTTNKKYCHCERSVAIHLPFLASTRFISSPTPTANPIDFPPNFHTTHSPKTSCCV